MTAPSSTVLASPQWNGIQFFDKNGNVLAGGQIVTYAGNSWTVQQTTYADDSGETPNTNPIILNINGVQDTGLWLTPDVYYNFQLLSASGIQLQIIENVIASSS